MNRIFMMCAAWVLILLIALGIAAPAMVSAESNIAVFGGIGLTGFAAWALFVLGKKIIEEFPHA